MNNSDNRGVEAEGHDSNPGEACNSSEASKKRKNRASNSEETSKKKKNGSGVVAKINKMTAYGSKKVQVQCNRRGQGVSQFSPLMQSYIGYLVRRYVSIEYHTWKKVPKQIKTNLYETIKNAFDIPPTMTEKAILKSTDNKWRNFKHGLSEFVIDGGVLHIEPPHDYIKQEAWEAYVQHRCTKEFQDMSRKNSERAKQNKYPYRLSKKGYARKEREMLVEEGKDPETSIIPRAKMWKVARQATEGVYYDKETAEVARKIDMYMEQQSQGTLTLSSTEDVLTLALDTEEQSGRVRAVGLRVTKKQYFGATKLRDTASKEEVTSLRSVVADLQKQLDDRRREMQNQIRSQAQVSPPLNNNNTSLSEVDSNSPNPDRQQEEVLKRCTLFWPNKTHEVAKGRVFIPQGGYKSVLHCQELDVNEVLKVIVDTVLPTCENMSVPYPTTEVTCLSKAPSYIIGWPASLVTEINFESSKSSRASSRSESMQFMSVHPQPQPKSELFKKCILILSRGKRFLMEIDMTKQILQHSHKLFIGNDELSCWLEQEEIEEVHVSFYMRFLYMKYKPTSQLFLCPARLSVVLDEGGVIVQSKDEKYDMRAIYMASAMCQSHASQPIWLAPYNSGNHWMLAMINPHQNKVYWLDPLRGEFPRDFVVMCTQALDTFQMRVHKSKGSKVSWINIKKCPLQPNLKLCGFFICRMMRDIAESGVRAIPESYLSGSSDSYSQQQIDEVTDEWLGHLDPYLQLAV